MCIFNDEFESMLNELSRLEKKLEERNKELSEKFEDDSWFDRGEGT